MVICLSAFFEKFFGVRLNTILYKIEWCLIFMTFISELAEY